MSYEMLLNDLEALQKSYAAAADEDDAKIQAAADAEDEGDEEDEEDEDEDKPAGKPFGKSFTLIGEDGSEVDAVDGTEMVKSLMDEMGALKQSAADERDNLTKSLAALVGVVKAQATVIQSLRDDVFAIANQGAGRRSITGPSAGMAKSMGAQLAPQTLMLKANTAFNAGRISGKDLTMVDVSMRHGEEISPELVARILAE